MRVGLKMKNVLLYVPFEKSHDFNYRLPHLITEKLFCSISVLLQ